MIYAEPPGETKGDTRIDVDMRVQKIFKIMGTRLTFLADIFNVLNNTDGLWGVYPRYGPYYMKRNQVKAPRTYRIGLRFVF